MKYILITMHSIGKLLLLFLLIQNTICFHVRLLPSLENQDREGKILKTNTFNQHTFKEH